MRKRHVGASKNNKLGIKYLYPDDRNSEPEKLPTYIIERVINKQRFKAKSKNLARAKEIATIIGDEAHQSLEDMKKAYKKYLETH